MSNSPSTPKVETVTYAQFDRFIRKAQKAAMREHGCSSTVRFFDSDDFIIETRPDKKTMKIRKGWREFAAKQAKCPRFREVEQMEV